MRSRLSLPNFSRAHNFYKKLEGVSSCGVTYLNDLVVLALSENIIKKGGDC